MLRLFPLVMLISGAIDSIRNLPATALFGPSLIFFFIAAAVCFLIPIALVSAQLTTRWTDRGGVYFWVSKALGKHVGFIAIWLQWINTMVWYPTILLFVAGIFFYLINPAFASNKAYLIAIILLTFWVLTLLNLRGLKTSARFASFCAVIGMVAPMILIISLAAFWVFSGKPLQVHLTWSSIFPSLHHSQSWLSLTAVVTSFLGMELACVHVSSVEKPQVVFPRALTIAVFLILVTMIFGSLAIAFVVPHDKISLVVGVMQAFSQFLSVYHMHWMIDLLALMIFIGSLGSMINWMISPAKGLLQAAESHFLPGFLQKVNIHNVPSRLLIVQAVVVSMVCGASVFIPSVSGMYWLLTDLSTELYLFMYVLLFIAAILLARYIPKQTSDGFVIPGGRWGTGCVCLLGLLGSLIAIGVGFIPPSNIPVGGAQHYLLMFKSGLVAMCLPVVLFFIYRACKVRAYVSNQ
jgi:glutamate:GABA antiporter